jgi:hypothetical protein
MFNIFSHKANVNQKSTEIPSHPTQTDNKQENKQQMLVKMGERWKPSYTVGGNIK